MRIEHPEPHLMEISPLLSVHQLRRVLAYFFLLTYLVLLAITWDGIDFASASRDGPLVFAFAVAVWLTYGPVSYTHLDVYKRQGLDRADDRRRRKENARIASQDCCP